MSGDVPGMPSWLGLLKWSLSYSDGTTDSTAKPMSEEDKKWLSTAMSELVKDEPARMNEICQLLLNRLQRYGPVPDAPSFKIAGSSSSDDDKSLCDPADDEVVLNSLDELLDIVEQIDMATICVKNHGIVPLIGILECDSEPCEEIRMLCATCIATIAQNNIKVQDQLFQKGLLMKLCRLCISDKTSPMLCAKVRRRRRRRRK